MLSSNKLIVNFVPTGMIPTKSDTSHVPISPDEIIEQVHEANEFGITLVHLHARDEQTEKPTYKSSVYQKILEGIWHYCPDLVTCVSLSGRDFKSFEQRSEVLELLPDMGSLTLGSLNFMKQESVNSPEMIRDLAQKMTLFGVVPELEVFDLGMIHYSKYLIKKNLIQSPLYYNVILGNIFGLQYDIASIGLALRELPEGALWSLGGIGNAQLTANTLAIASGGGVRVGLEDNLFYDKEQTQKATNLNLVTRIHKIAHLMGREIMRPSEFGQLGFYNTKNPIRGRLKK